MTTIEEDWERFLKEAIVHEDRLSPYQKDVMKWCFYSGYACLMGVMRELGEKDCSADSVAKRFNELHDELVTFFEKEAAGRPH